jgi:hypothetical protein
MVLKLNSFTSCKANVYILVPNHLGTLMRHAPIALFTYNRPDHTRRVLESLALNEDSENSELFIFCDAPKKAEHADGVEQVKQVARSRAWCGKVHIIEREKNMGCANSIINGVTDLCGQYGRVIVIEDDLVLTPYFLSYMNTALELYKNEPRVMQISGHMFPINLHADTDALFLPFITSWGWATWQRSWKHFDPDMLGHDQIKNCPTLQHKFDLNASYPYFKMLEEQLNGKIDSWAIRWYLSVFMLGGLTLYPLKSLVENSGFDGSGIHCGQSEAEVILSREGVSKFPTFVKEDKTLSRQVYHYLSQPRQFKLRNLPEKIKRNLLDFVKKPAFREV